MDFQDINKGFTALAEANSSKAVPAAEDITGHINSVIKRTQAHMKPSRYLLDLGKDRENAEDNGGIVVDQTSDEEREVEDIDMMSIASNELHVDNWDIDARRSERSVVVDGTILNIWDYLGEEWSSMILAKEKVPPVHGSSDLITPLEEWQKVGIAKAKYTSDGPFQACINGDEMGLGKTLQAFELCMLEKDQPGFFLILTPKSVASQWLEEYKAHYNEETRPRILLLEDPKTTANDIVDGRYKFVICSYQFVLAQKQAMTNFEQFHEYVELVGIDAARKNVRPREVQDPAKRVTSSIITDVYETVGYPILRLVLDEVQYIKNHVGKTHNAILEIKCRKVLMLSGSFLDNRWRDAFGLLRLIPTDHPFKTLPRFDSAFAAKRGDVYKDPSATKRNRFVKFMQLLVVSRPSDVLDIEAKEIHEERFPVDDDDRATIAAFTYKFIETLKLGRGQRVNGAEMQTNDKRKIALGYAMRARQYCANKVLVPARELNRINPFLEKAHELLQEFVERIAVGNMSLEEKEEALVDYLRDMAIGAMRKEKKSDKKVIVETDGAEIEPAIVDSDEEEDPTYQPSETGASEDQGTKDNVLHDEEGGGDIGEDEEGEEDDPTNATKGPQDRTAWLNTVKGFSDTDLLSNKVVAHLQRIKHIRHAYPGEKIIIFSEFLQFLDIMQEAIRRDSALKKIRVGTYNGRMSTRERDLIKAEFKSRDVSIDTLLITKGAGGTGLNLQAANHMIQSEPWWNINHEKQALGRLYRKGQEKKVHLWRIMGEMSMIDMVITSASKKKEMINEAIMKYLRRKDEESVDIPRQYRYGVGEM